VAQTIRDARRLVRYQRNETEGKAPDFDVSEDFWFYQRAQEEGFACWVDWETEVGHLAQIVVTGRITTPRTSPAWKP
jgi:hypothetical protein